MTEQRTPEQTRKLYVDLAMKALEAAPGAFAGNKRPGLVVIGLAEDLQAYVERGEVPAGV